MSLISCKEQGMLNRSVNGISESTATRYFIAIFDAAATTVQAESAPGIEVGEVHPDTATDDYPRVCKTIEARCDAESQNRHFVVQVDYSSQVDTDPRSLPPEISWDFDDASHPYFIDYDPNGKSKNPDGTPGKPCANTAGAVFENFLERETGSLRATYKKNVDAGVYDPAVALAYKDAVNADGFAIDGKSIKPGQAKLKAYTAAATQSQFVNGKKVFYRAVTFNLQFRASWDDVIDSRGVEELDPTKGDIGTRDICSTRTPPVKPVQGQPWPLDAKGHAAANPKAAPAQLTFIPYKKKPFSKFGFK